MSSSNLFITNYLTGNVGYDPVSALNISANIILSLVFFIAGLVIYSKFCWKSE
jgi:Ni,Fe-hydrogenase I cytochrome b subunit